MQPLRTVDVQLQVNGQDHALRLTSAATLLNVLRNDLGLNSPKFGCGLGQCGACTVLIDGTPARACVIPAQEIQHRDITTSEGLGQARSLLAAGAARGGLRRHLHHQRRAGGLR